MAVVVKLILWAVFVYLLSFPPAKNTAGGAKDNIISDCFGSQRESVVAYSTYVQSEGSKEGSREKDVS